jgi:hypothetical protein
MPTSPPSSHRARGMPPRAVFNRAADVLPYYGPRPSSEWRLVRSGLGARVATALQVAGVLVCLVVLIVAAFNYDEYERATRRLTLPFTEQSVYVSWSSPDYVRWRRSESLTHLRYCGYAASVGIILVAAGAVHALRRRRRTSGRA